MASHARAAFDDRPIFDKALRYGVEQGILPVERVKLMQEDFAKGIVQIANFFGTAHLRPDLEFALRRMVNLISLYLEDMSEGDVRIAANSLRDKSFLSHSKAGSDMLKRLHALPDSTVIAGNSVSAEQQRAFLDEKTASDGINLVDYRTELALRQENQGLIEFSFWLARKMGVARDEVEDTDALIRSAMLVLFVDQAELQLPTRSTFVKLVKAAKSAGAKLNDLRLKTFLREAPPDFQRLAREGMQRFVTKDLPVIRKTGNTADKLLYGDTGEGYFFRESLDEDNGEYDRLVAKEWHRVTKGESDDPAVLATVFLFLATGLPPKASMLQREGKDLIQNFRARGFDAAAVTRFITEHAPHALQEELLKFWQEELQGEAEGQLADKDPSFPDTHMDRGLEYLRQTCAVTWKAPRR